MEIAVIEIVSVIYFIYTYMVWADKYQQKIDRNCAKPKTDVILSRSRYTFILAWRHEPRKYLYIKCISLIQIHEELFVSSHSLPLYVEWNVWNVCVKTNICIPGVNWYKHSEMTSIVKRELKTFYKCQKSLFSFITSSCIHLVNWYNSKSRIYFVGKPVK